MNNVVCPICQRTMVGQSTRDWPQYPFCGPKCRVIDLGRWMGGSYRIAAEFDEEVDAEIDTLDEPP